jgi:ABC-type multidrug transport system ATPase subunit
MEDAGGSLSGVTKRFSRRGPWVLEGIDLDLQPGSRTVIVGGNGSGKSTLLRVAAGVSRPNGGTVKLSARIGYVPERLAARTRFTGTEYLSHMGRIKGLHTATIAARSGELLERLDLQPGANERIDSLSKGNRQKLIVAQAYMAQVGLLVLDEPFSGLDQTAHGALAELTEEAQSRGTAVLISSHRAVPEQEGVRQLRIGGGQLVEVFHDRLSRSSRTPAIEIEIELASTEGAQDREQVAAIPGVTSVRVGHSDGVLVLLTDESHVDRVLVAAIDLGWSVRSVQTRVRKVPTK